MEIPLEVLAARELLEPIALALPGVTGIDVGVADEESPDFDNAVVRVFVKDLGFVPDGIPADIDGVPVVVRQGEFVVDQLPDQNYYRPVVGGSEVGPLRDIPTGSGLIHRGTLGAIVRDSDGSQILGLSNFHVIAGDSTRARGQGMSQP